MDDHPIAGSHTVVCDCCELDVPERLSSAVRDAHSLVRGWLCRQCNEHRADHLRKAQEHEEELRMRWRETFDELSAALDLAQDYKEKMHAAYRSRDNVLRRIERLGRYHREADHGCICGQRKCKTLEIISDDWINNTIARMHSRNTG